MTWLRQYLLCVTCAAIICSFIKTIVAQNGTSATLIKILTGLFLTVSILVPWTKFRFDDMVNYVQEFSLDADAAAASGVLFAQQETESIIKKQTETYILDKAAQLGLDLQVDVTIRQDTLPVPNTVLLIGNTSPYAKEKLSQVISKDLGIPEEQQIWR